MKSTRGNGRGEREEASRKSRARNSRDCDGNFRNYSPTSYTRHFLPPSHTFPPLIRSPFVLPPCMYLSLSPSPSPSAFCRAMAARDRVSTAVTAGKTRACIQHFCRFHIMRNLTCVIKFLRSMVFKANSSWNSLDLV